MFGIKITPRKKRVTWYDQVQAEASRPRASYTQPPLDDEGIMKFINQEAAKQKQDKKLEWWEKLASPTKAQWTYANAYHRAEEYARKRGALGPQRKKATPTRCSSSFHAKEETRQTKNLPDPDGTGTGLS